MTKPVLEMWEGVWIGDYLGTVTGVSKTFNSGNLYDNEGNPARGREYTIFIGEDE